MPPRFSFNNELTSSMNAPLGFQVLCKMNLYLDNHFPAIMNFLHALLERGQNNQPKENQHKVTP
jgi:hypothetical protein